MRAGTGKAAFEQMLTGEPPVRDPYFMLRFKNVKKLTIVDQRGLGDELWNLLGGIDPVEWFNTNCSKEMRLDHSIRELFAPGI